MFSSRERPLSRREWLQLSAAGALSAPVATWFSGLAQGAAAQGVKHKSCILLFMTGGPSQAHTFDVKPDIGEFKAIASSVPGIQISEYLPKIAQQMQHMALLRSMSTGEFDHHRGRYLMHTGFRAGGAAVYPSIGAVAARELAQPDFELPNFVTIGNSNERYTRAGYLGAQYNPLIVADPAKGVENLKPPPDSNLESRAELVHEFDSDFLEQYQAASVEAHRKSYLGAVRTIRSPKSKAFDLSSEPASMREAYGNNKFGEGCLMARRLVEAGVPFVEVPWSPGVWDDHGGAAKSVKPRSPALDAGMGTLIADLKDRGLLDSTLVIWTGEFGRTPIDGKGHFGRCWTSVLAGAGLKLGQVVGRTDKSGGTVEELPISAGDFMATICQALGIDHAKRYVAPGNRRVGIVDKDAKPVAPLFA